MIVPYACDGPNTTITIILPQVMIVRFLQHIDIGVT